DLKADRTEENSMGKFDVLSVVRSGTMYVIRDAGFEIGLMKEPYRGSVPIVSGEIGEDFAYYLSKSEQINSAVSIGVHLKVRRDGSDPGNGGKPEFSLDRLRVAAAGGYIVQIMPSAGEEIISYLERTIPMAPNST